MNLSTNKFFNSTDIHVSSRMNEYLKKNFGYEVKGDIASLKEAKKSLELEQVELKKDGYMNQKYMENMLMIETIGSLLKAHNETDDINEERVDEIVPLVIGGLARAAVGAVAKKAVGAVGGARCQPAREHAAAENLAPCGRTNLHPRVHRRQRRRDGGTRVLADDPQQSRPARVQLEVARDTAAADGMRQLAKRRLRREPDEV